MQHYSTVITSESFRVISAIEEFDGTCDPAFDNNLDELRTAICRTPLLKPVT